MTTTNVTIRCRNNADARRMGAGQVRIPGARSIRRTGGKTVKAELVAVDTAKAWLDAAYEVDSYEIDPV